MFTTTDIGTLIACSSESGSPDDCRTETSVRRVVVLTACAYRRSSHESLPRLAAGRWHYHANRDEIVRLAEEEADISDLQRCTARRNSFVNGQDSAVYR